MEDSELIYLRAMIAQAVTECFDTDILDLIYKLLINDKR